MPKNLNGKGGYPPPLNGKNPLSSFWKVPLCSGATKYACFDWIGKGVWTQFSLWWNDCRQMFSFLGFSKRDILQTYSTHHFWSKQTDSRWWWPILYKRPSSDSLGRMWKLHMYWRLNIIYNIVIINIYFLIFSISSVSLTSNWAAVGMSLLARFSASALTSSRWSDGLRRKEK